MLRFLRFTVAAAAIALAGLLVRRLLLQAGAPGSLPSATQDFAGSSPEQPLGVEGAVSPRALRSAARSLPGTREELYRQAARLGVRGRSRMNKRQLHEAVEAQSSGDDSGPAKQHQSPNRPITQRRR
jgi:hypothetical protein